MGMEWIRKTYAVPAKRGGRVEYIGDGEREQGTIRSAKDGQLMIQLDGVKHAMPFHPTWKLRYLDAGDSNRSVPASMKEWRDANPEPAHGCGHMQGRGAA